MSSRTRTPLFQECAVSVIRLVNIRLTCDLPGRMHIEYGDTEINNLHTQICKNISDRSVAARIYLSKL